MGKNKRKQVPCFDTFHNVEVQCDSTEECDFIQWCSEMAQLKLVHDYTYQPSPFKLFDKVDYTSFDGKKRSLFREHIYSPDFSVTFCPREVELLCKHFKVPQESMQADEFTVCIDVKGTFQKSDGGRAFSINQKWVYQKHGVYVVKVVPKDFFAVCGCPNACRLTKKTNKPRKAFEGMKSISEVFGVEDSCH